MVYLNMWGNVRDLYVLEIFSEITENVIFSQARMSPVADLGFGVLNTAMAETLAFVLEK